MLTIEDMLAPVADLPPTKTFTFERLRGKPQLELLPMSTKNPKWFDLQLREGMKKDAAPAEVEDEGLTLEKLKERKRAMADVIADTLVVSFTVEVAEGQRLGRQDVVDVTRELLHKLIDVPQGIAEFLKLQEFVETHAVETHRASVHPEATAGNSSGG